MLMSFSPPLLILHLPLRVMHLFIVDWTLSWPFKWHMVSFWWMCSQSFRPCVRIWQAFDSLLHHLLLMMSLDCPSAIRHKKGEYILMEIGGDFEFLELWSFRLYLGALWYIYIYIYILAHDVFISWCFIFYGLYMLGGDIMFLFLFLILHVLHWLLIYIMRLFMIYVFYFLFCKIKNFFCFYLYFPHMHLCVYWVF